ncbi:hypothetical protein ACWKSP_41560 [Micromonosporaceae bacterium Da 78-11]
MTVAEEHEDVKRIRHRAADASMGFGLIALVLAIFSKTPVILPGYGLIVLGGLSAIGVYRAADTTMSRWFTLWSAVLTVLGSGALVLASQLAD